MTLSPSRRSVPPDDVHRGRRAADEVEAASPAGRALHWLEAVVMDAAVSLVQLCEAHERETLLDGDCDARVLSAICALDAGRPIEARALLLEYRERDQLRDAEHVAQRGHAGLVRACLRRIGRWIEKSCAALREVRR